MQHLNAALALWDYCERSAAWVFEMGTGNKNADKILSALKAAGQKGLTKWEITVKCSTVTPRSSRSMKRCGYCTPKARSSQVEKTGRTIGRTLVLPSHRREESEETSTLETEKRQILRFLRALRLLKTRVRRSRTQRPKARRDE